MLPASSSIVCWPYPVQGTSKSVLAQPPAELVLTSLLLQPESRSNTLQFLNEFVCFPSSLFLLPLHSFFLLPIPYLFRATSTNYPWIPVNLFSLVWPSPSSQCTFFIFAGFFSLGLPPGLVLAWGTIAGRLMSAVTPLFYFGRPFLGIVTKCDVNNYVFTLPFCPTNGRHFQNNKGA